MRRKESVWREEPENGKRHVCRTKEKVSYTGLGLTVLLDLVVEELAKVISLLFPLLEVAEGGDFIPVVGIRSTCWRSVCC